LLYDIHDDRIGPELFERTYMNEQTCGNWAPVGKGYLRHLSKCSEQIEMGGTIALLEFMLHSDGCLTGLAFLTLYSSRNQLNERVTDK